jgi:chromosome segregation ATPase
MVSQGPSTNSQTIRSFNHLLNTFPELTSELQELKATITFAESRNSQLLHEKEDVTLTLQTEAYRKNKAVKKQESEVKNSRDKIVTLENLLAEVKQHHRRSELGLIEKRKALTIEVETKEKMQLQLEELKNNLGETILKDKRTRGLC